MEKSKINLEKEYSSMTKKNYYNNVSNPNLKFNQIISRGIYCGGYNDIFEILSC